MKKVIKEHSTKSYLKVSSRNLRKSVLTSSRTQSCNSRNIKFRQWTRSRASSAQLLVSQHISQTFILMFYVYLLDVRATVFQNFSQPKLCKSTQTLLAISAKTNQERNKVWSKWQILFARTRTVKKKTIVAYFKLLLRISVKIIGPLGS